MIECTKAGAERVVPTGEGCLTELSTAELKELSALRKEAVGRERRVTRESGLPRATSTGRINLLCERQRSRSSSTTARFSRFGCVCPTAQALKFVTQRC